jgi:hypothetical protein
VAQVIGILTFHYQLQFLCLPKHLYTINRYSWPISNALSVTFVLPLLINIVDIADWCINQHVRSVPPLVELLSVESSTADILALLIVARAHLTAVITSGAISKGNM